MFDPSTLLAAAFVGGIAGAVWLVHRQDKLEKKLTEKMFSDFNERLKADTPHIKALAEDRRIAAARIAAFTEIEEKRQSSEKLIDDARKAREQAEHDELVNAVIMPVGFPPLEAAQAIVNEAASSVITRAA